MKLHKLVLQAFGPYTERVVLDFDAGLAGSTMFLIHGKTGAGKTTILDGLAFALYGEASGSARSGAMLRSDFVDKKSKTEVELEFSLGSTRYRVRRTPTYTVEGNKTARQATAALYEIADGGEHLVAGKPNDVTSRIVALTGFDAKEFRQVVLLPQGEFRTFLLAKSNERSKLMTTLFDTGKYGVLEAKLKERRDAIRTANEENRREQERLLGEASADNAAALQKQAEDEAAGLAAKRAAVESAGAQHTAAQQALADGTALAGWFDKLREAEAAQAADAQKQEKVEAYRQQLDRAKRAVLLMDKAKHAQQAQANAKESAQRAKELETARQTAEAKAKQAEAAFTAEEAKRPQREASRQRAQSLAEAQKTIHAMVVLRDQAAAAERAAKNAATQNTQAAADVATAKKTVDRLRFLERAGKAFSLAQGLVDGAPCPVCGATEHPHPAETEELVPTDKEIQQAEAALARAEKAQAAAQAAEAQRAAEAAALTGKLAAAREHLPEGLAEDEAAAAAAVREAAAGAQQLEQAYEQARKAHETAQAALSAARANAESSKAYAEAQQAEQEQATRIFGEGCIAAGFPDLAAFLAAIEGRWREPAFLTQVEQHIREFEDQKLQHATQRQEAELQTKGKTRPDLAALQAAAQAAGAAWKQAVETANAAELRLAQEKKQIEQLAKLQKAEAALAEKARVIGHLAQVACAEHPYRVHFQTYIQKSIFDDVMAAANERLRIMSSGRYELQNGKEANGHAFEGLAIAVFDAYTGKKRETSSLSGGESFLASLALALGLADTVTRYSEGIRLDTMFIDEGFGSLDEETLDTALKALMKLQEGGRVIGIISHVKELAECIGDRIEVVKTTKGSTAHFAHGTLAE